MRIPLSTLLAGVAVALIGGAGLIRGAVPLGVASGGGSSGSAPIVVTGAYVREPAPPTDAAAAYFTVYNTTGTDDRLLSVVTGAGRTSTLHTLVDGRMTAAANGAVIPAHGTLVLSTGTGHVMIENLFGTLKPGQSVNLALTFATAGTITVSAPVIALGAPAPTGSNSGATSAPASSGATK
jgi:periplasmic copper chaperone A